MEIETLNAPYVIEKGEVEGQIVQVTIRAVEGGMLGYDEVREATKRILDHFRRAEIHTVERYEGQRVVDPHSDEAAMALEDLVSAYNSNKGRVSDEYLARLAAAYEALVPEGRGVSTSIADALGKPVPTVKGHIMRARRQGYLSEAIEGREGGEATASARELLRKIDELAKTAQLKSVSYSPAGGRGSAKP
jgi:DNA-binding transcriptional ArsR family regulator